MNKLTGTILTLPKMSGNVGAKTINIGGKGDDGATFTPSISADGIISWTNDKDLPNPEPVNIKGTKGDKGDKGDTGEKGDKGEKGEPGVSVTHHWEGTKLVVTSASGTSSADLKGKIEEVDRIVLVDRENYSRYELYMSGGKLMASELEILPVSVENENCTVDVDFSGYAGYPLRATVTASEGYWISSVVAGMDSEECGTFDPDTGILTIDKVTADVVIAAIAEPFDTEEGA